jgi:hypothetical protein
MKIRLPAFDVMLDLARNDPAQLEALRETLTSAVIAGAASDDHRRRLKGLQFRIEMERRRAATPLAATIRISEMMTQSLADLHRTLVIPLEPQPPKRAAMAGGVRPVTAAPTPQATVLQFRAPETD